MKEANELYLPTALMRISSSRPVHLRSEMGVSVGERGLGAQARASRPGPFGFLCTGGLALATMTEGRATAVMMSGEGGKRSGSYREGRMERRELIYRTERGGREVVHF